MKRLLFAMILATSLALIFSACDDSVDTNNTISEAELTDRESAILSATTDKSFVFDFNIDSTYNELSVWVEKYELGELVDDKIAHLTTNVKDNGQIIFSLLESYDDENLSMFNVSIVDEGGTSRGSYLDEILEGASSTWGSNQAENIAIEGEIVLANITFSEDTGMSSLSTDFFSDVENHLDEIKDYDVVYLLKSEFIR